MKEHKHDYFYNEDGQAECLTCGFLETPKDKCSETVERIVIDYANLSGRESANRAEFRKRTQEHISSLLKAQKEKIGQIMADTLSVDTKKSFQEVGEMYKKLDLLK